MSNKDRVRGLERELYDLEERRRQVVFELNQLDRQITAIGKDLLLYKARRHDKAT